MDPRAIAQAALAALQQKQQQQQHLQQHYLQQQQQQYQFQAPPIPPAPGQVPPPPLPPPQYYYPPQVHQQHQQHIGVIPPYVGGHPAPHFKTSLPLPVPVPTSIPPPPPPPPPSFHPSNTNATRAAAIAPALYSASTSSDSATAAAPVSHSDAIVGGALEPSYASYAPSYAPYASSSSSFPSSIPAPLAPPANTTFALVDVQSMNVGHMCNIVRTAKKMGLPRYQPIDMSIVMQVSIPHIEPGRLDARVAEFYRALDALKKGPVEPQQQQQQQQQGDSTRVAKEEGGLLTQGSSVRYPVSSGQRDGSNHNSSRMVGSVKLEGWERHVLSAAELEELTGESYVAPNQEDRGGRFKSRKHTRDGRAIGSNEDSGAAGAETEISEDNVGHKLLKGLGWKSGSGLGVDGSGIVVPVKASGSSGGANSGGVTIGIGGASSSSSSSNATDGNTQSNTYLSYREQLSSSYHKR